MALVSHPWRPIKVLVLDSEELPDEVVLDPSYGGMWALIREQRRPRGLLKTSLEEGRIGRAELLDAIAELPPNPPAEPLRLPNGIQPPRISVVVSTLFERLDLLDACLASLAAIDYPDFEIIVIDNRDSEAPPITLENVKLVRESRPGLSAARNRGIAEATGEIVAFTDDDVTADPAWLLAIASRLLAHPEEAGVTGLVLPSELETRAQAGIEGYYGEFGPRIFEPLSHLLRNPPGTGSPLALPLVEAFGEDGEVRRSFSLYAIGSVGVGANMAFRTEILRAVGGFDPALGAGTPAPGGEDLFMFLRLIWQGHGLGFEPAALLHHTHRRAPDALRQQIYGYGLGWTAVLFASVLEDPRHLGRMLGTAPRGAKEMSRTFLRKVSSRRTEPSAPPSSDGDQPAEALTAELARLELRGMLRGPVAYLRSRRWSR